MWFGAPLNEMIMIRILSIWQKTAGCCSSGGLWRKSAGAATITRKGVRWLTATSPFPGAVWHRCTEGVMVFLAFSWSKGVWFTSATPQSLRWQGGTSMSGDSHKNMRPHGPWLPTVQSTHHHCEPLGRIPRVPHRTSLSLGRAFDCQSGSTITWTKTKQALGFAGHLQTKLSRKDMKYMIMIDFAWLQLVLAWSKSQMHQGTLGFWHVKVQDFSMKMQCAATIPMTPRGAPRGLLLFSLSPGLWQDVDASAVRLHRRRAAGLLFCSLEISVDGNLVKLRSSGWKLLIRTWKSQRIALVCLAAWIAISQGSELRLQLNPKAYKISITGWIPMDLY